MSVKQETHDYAVRQLERQADLIQRAAELFTRYVTVAPPEYSEDVKQWLKDAGLPLDMTVNPGIKNNK